MAVFGFVLDEYDVPHDNPQGFIVLGSGTLAGLTLGAVLGLRAALRESTTRVAWDVVRFVLAYEMIRYGVPKLIGMQFYPQYFRWDRRVIDQTPMALAWEFLGRTYWYQAFGGLIEVGSGVLICFRRTTLLGACVMATALLNVVLIDYFYGMPVKLFASVYLLFDVALISRDWRRLCAFFVAPVQRTDRGRWIYGLVVSLTIATPIVKMLREGMKHRVFEREPLEGAWRVDERSGAVPAGWDRLYFEKDDVGFIRVGAKLIPFQKQVEGTRLRLAVAGVDDLHNDLRAIAGTSGFPHTVDGAIVLESQVLRFDGTCDGQPCAMKAALEFPR
jgi:hypothetical protein